VEDYHEGPQQQYTFFAQTQPQIIPKDLDPQSVGEIDFMKKELKNKDMLITNLKERLQNLEEKVNLIHREEQRDKSQQRIKDAIVNLEQKLEQFSKEREENNRKL
jgi:DNA repair exonuclease SbcCD ATPase subunit